MTPRLTLTPTPNPKLGWEAERAAKQAEDTAAAKETEDRLAKIERRIVEELQVSLFCVSVVYVCDI